MQRTTVLALILISFALVSHSAHAQEKAKTPPPPTASERNEEVRKIIQEAWDKCDKAFLEKNIEGMFASFAPDFIGFSAKGAKITLAQQKAVYQKMMPMLSSIESSTQVEKVTVKGDTASAIVSGYSRTQGVRPDGKALEVVTTNKQRQFWILKSGTWLVKQVRTLSEKMTVNGRPYP